MARKSSMIISGDQEGRLSLLAGISRGGNVPPLVELEAGVVSGMNQEKALKWINPRYYNNMQEPSTVPITAEDIRASLHEFRSRRGRQLLDELLEYELDE
ncbi:MAG TPA: hypothetical protein VKA06_09930, partial [Spirochaetia bacterium]|nr:hypothetical protein [Spirochaetia bacterium]